MTSDICIIGGSGFIGTRLVQRLSKRPGLNVKIFDKSPSAIFNELTHVGDVRSLDALTSGIGHNSVIVNLAAEHRDDVRPASLYDEVNVQGARNICEVARVKGVSTIVFTSSVAVYGLSRLGTDESGPVAPFNDYGRTKYEAEQVFSAWQAEAPSQRALVIIRPTVVFGERNRGNVYRLLSKIASRRFVMVGAGDNRKSMAYVENVAAFIERTIDSTPGVHVYNYVDKPDLTMNELVAAVKYQLGQSPVISFRVPCAAGYLIGRGFDLLSLVTGRQFSISSIRIKKFCANSVYNSAVMSTNFVAPVPLDKALHETIMYEFSGKRQSGDNVFYTE